MKKLLVLLSLLVPLTSFSEESGTKEIISLLISAKATGMCGTLKQLAAFQESTKMPGGDEFLVRFINTEVARLGKTQEQFFSECQVAVATYTRTMKALGFE